MLRRPLTLVTTLVILLSFIGLVPATAASTSERQRQIEAEKAALRQKIRQADQQAKSLSGQIAASDRRRAALEGEITSLNARLRLSEQKLRDTELTLEDARSDLLSFEDSLNASLARLGKLKSRQQLRARQTYMVGPGVYLELLVSAKSLRQVISRFVFVRKVFTKDRDRLAAVEQLTKQLSAGRGEALERKTNIEAQRAAIEAEKQNIANLRAAVNGKRSQVVNEISTRQQLLGQVKSDRAEYLRQVAVLEAESKSITRLLKGRQRGQVFQAGGTKRLAWPTTGSVTSPFGYRTHPIFGDVRFHTGIDIGAPTGQAIIAAEAGEVIFVGVKQGYGNMVLIDNGNALATLYAHLSSTSVATGARVGRGARVGGVGCTGYCTGPHLHFETRINGDPVDPMQFF